MKRLSILLILATIFLGCKTPPIHDLPEKLTSKVELESSKEALKMYFPQFYNDDGKVIGGDGIVIIFPNKEVMLIDGFLSGAEEQLISFIKNLGIKKIDYLVATHYHNDHIGNQKAVVENFEIGKFISNDAPLNDSLSADLLAIVKEKNIPHEIWKEGDIINFTPLCSCKVYWPNLSQEDKDTIFYRPGRKQDKINQSSLLFKLQYENFTMLFTGDIYKKGEKEIVKKYGKDLKSTILKAPHHGDRYTSNSKVFIRNVDPDYAVIQDNRYVTNIISNRYKKAGSQIIYRLTPGYVLIESDGKNYKMTEKSF